MAAAASMEDALLSRSRRRYYVMAENGPQVVRDVLESQGWLPFIEGESPYWNLWWKGSRYRKSDYADCRTWQRLNHFPKTISMTRKDSLYRLLRTMRGIYGAIYDYVPQTFSLPNDYVKFVRVYAEEEEKGNRSMWICKPADQSRGRGIFVFRHLTELTYDCSAVLQRYIPNPLLISGYKFDMRCYVVVRSYNPLVIYLNEEGLARFATSPYTTDSLSNVYAHLTNTSINKFSPSLTYEKEEVGTGCRWTFARLRAWFEATGMDFDRAWRRTQATIISTLLPIAAEVPPVPSGCFELYGFDILLDDTLTPWLLEVNFGPALSLDTHVDVEIKKPLIADIVSLIAVTEHEVSMAQEAARLDEDNMYQRKSTSAHREKTACKTDILASVREVGRLKRIFPFNGETARLNCQPLTVGKPALKKVILEIRKGLMS